MGQDVWFVMADRVCSGSPKNSAAKSACGDDDDDDDEVAVVSDSRSGGSRSSLTVVAAEDGTRSQISSVAPGVLQSVDVAASESSERGELLGARQMTQRFRLQSSGQLVSAHPGHEQEEEVCSFQTPDSGRLVPNIVVECMAATRDAHGHRLTPPFVLPASSDWSLSSPVSSSRQIRALSDSSVYELERSPVLNSSYIPLVGSDFRYVHPWKSLTDVGEKGEVATSSEVADLRTTPSLLRDLRKSKTCSRLSAVIEPEQDDAELCGENKPTDLLPTVPFHWHSHSSHRTRFGQGKSPKTYWMRRHSDSNLTNRQVPSLRLEPYPIRSRSTGDSIPGSATVPESSTSAEMPSSELGASVAQTSTEKHPSEEKSTGLYEKRLKLKKYLQTRYQTSLLEMRQSGDADDVFTDRSLDPGSPPGSLVSSASEVHINVSPLYRKSDAGRKAVQDESDIEMPEKVFCYEGQGPRTKVLSEEDEYSFDYSGTSTRHSLLSERHLMRTEEGATSSSGIRSSEMPVFVFPVPPSTHVSDPVVSPPWWRQHVVAQGQVSASSGGLFPRSEPMDPPGIIARTPLELQKRKSAAGESPHHHSRSEERHHQKFVPKQPPPPEALGAYSHFPLLVDLPAEKPFRRVHLRCSPWEGSDQRTPTSALTRPQSYSSLLTFSSTISEQPSFPLTRFPSSPALSDYPTVSPSLVSSWREARDTSPRLLSSPSVARASGSSDRSLVMRHSYSPLRESGPDRDESTAAARSKFTCPLCNQEFISYNHLTNHMSSHLLPPEGASKESSPTEGLKVHLCRVCNRAFSRSDMLTRHTRLHTGLRPYECHLCGQVFSRSDHLHTHLRTHTGEKPYKCTSCPYAAPRRDMVTRHMRIHARDVPHRGRRSASISSDVLPSPHYTDLTGVSSDEVCRRIQSLSSVEPTSRSLSLSHDSPTNALAEDTDLGLVHQVISCRTCSLTSSESTEGSDLSHVYPASCHTWSSTSAESFESFSSPRLREHLSWSSSADSPDVFCRTPQFLWSVRAAGHHRSNERSQRDSSSSAVETLSIEMQTSFERCSVTTPEHDSREVTTGETKPTYEIYGQDARVKVEKESPLDKDC